MARPLPLAGMVLLGLVVGCGGGGAKPDGSAGTGGGAAGTGTAGTSAGAAPDAAAGTMGAAGTSAPPEPASDAQIPTVDAPSGSEIGGACTPCTDYAAAVQSGRVMNAMLDQLSGIAVSHKNPGVLFVHNDRTSTAVWALSQAGALLATYTFTGVTVIDVEDIAVGPCPSGTCVFLADIGGNIAARPDYTIVRFPEPTVPAGGGATVTVAAEKLVYTYPDGALHNAESLLIDPRSGTPYVIDKVAAGMPSTAYRLSATFGGAAIVATKVGTLPVPAAGDMPATAADAHPCGTGFILATGNNAYEFRIAATAPFEDAFKSTPVVVPVAAEQQREGIAYQPDGRGFYTNSEGAMQPIHHTACR